MKPTQIEILRSLPQAPDGYYYTIQDVSPMVSKVWLNDTRVFSHTADPVRTIYCFIKNNKVHAPASKDKMRPKSVCTLSNLHTQDPYSTIVPTCRDLTHIK